MAVSINRRWSSQFTANPYVGSVSQKSSRPTSPTAANIHADFRILLRRLLDRVNRYDLVQPHDRLSIGAGEVVIELRLSDRYLIRVTL